MTNLLKTIGVVSTLLLTTVAVTMAFTTVPVTAGDLRDVGHKPGDRGH